ncbi:MAG: hypothetical protein WCZ66_02495 [Sphingomonadaceae bacterium]
MLHYLPESLRPWCERLGPRAAGLLLTVLVQCLLGWMLLTMGATVVREKMREVAMMVVHIPAPKQDREERAAESPKPASVPAPKPRSRPAEAPPEAVVPVVPPVVVPLPSDIPIIDISPAPPAKVPAKPAGPVYGPPAPPSAAASDTPLVEGAGPNGEALYAASWYREPYPNELRGYLSTARGPGWALIACRTVRDFRVEGCVQVAEYPEGSGIVNAVLAAAWQFRVRPPQKGGMPMVGEWVRIRIDYEMRPQRREY